MCKLHDQGSIGDNYNGLLQLLFAAVSDDDDDGDDCNGCMIQAMDQVEYCDKNDDYDDGNDCVMQVM